MGTKAIGAMSAAAAIALAPLPPAAAGAQADGPQDAQQYSTIVRVSRRAVQRADAPEPTAATLPRGSYSDHALRQLVTRDDIPADFRRRALRGESALALDVGPSGRAANCRVIASSGEARLDRIACERIQERGVFAPLYEGPGRPLPSRILIGVAWYVGPPLPPMLGPPLAAPPLPAPRTGWPRLRWSGHVRPVDLPPIQRHYPAVTRAEGMVSLDLHMTPQQGITECRIGVGSGDPALDEAACRVARSLDLRYENACENCREDPLPLQVVWKRRGGSHIRLPLYGAARGQDLRDPADRRPATAEHLMSMRALPFDVAPRDFAAIADRTIRNPLLEVNLDVSEAGRATACTVRMTTGNAAVDARACEIIVQRSRFLPATDIFGDPVARTERVVRRLDLGALAPTP